MKLFSAILAAAISSVVARIQRVPVDRSEIAADSEFGLKLLSKARRVEQEDEDQAVDITWVSGYSLKFQGCHHVQQWNDDADEAEDVRIQTKRLVRFRLCPSKSCSESKAGGCKSGYGDYIVDLNSYVQAYFEATRRSMEYSCEYYLNNNCDCEDDDGKGDDFDRDYCEYDCFADADMTETCSDRNPYEDDENREEEFNVEEYMECQQWNPPEDEDDGEDQNDNRRLEDEGEAEEEDEDEWFIGPYCAEQGGAVYLGLFTDDACTSFADNAGGKATFKELSGGSQLPYSSVTVVGAECISCLDLDYENEDNNGNGDNGAGVSEACEQIYQSAGKCENWLSSGVVDEPNTGACNYIEGIKIIRQDGIITSGARRPSATATVFIVLFALAFAALSFYVYYLRMRLGVKQNTLL